MPRTSFPAKCADRDGLHLILRRISGQGFVFDPALCYPLKVTGFRAHVLHGDRLLTEGRVVEIQKAGEDESESLGDRPGNLPV